MGIIISRFRKTKTTKEKLQALVKDIKGIEEFRQHTQKRQRDIVGRFVLISVLVFIVIAVCFYFYAFPERIVDRVLYITPLFLFPFIIVFLKRIITWYYSRKLSRNEERLAKLQEEKKKLLDDVMDKETYKNAKEILEQFAPEQLRKEAAGSMVKPGGIVVRPSPMVGQAGGVVVPGGPAVGGPQDVRRRLVAGPQQQAAPTPGGWRALPPPGTPMTPYQQRPSLPPGPPMPRPVLPQERGVFDRLVDFVVGDGPSNRYALVCRQCASHNGMALQEEFEYLAFRCCYCFTWNPARKQRPQAPRLPGPASSQEEEDGESSLSTASSDEGEGEEQAEGEAQTEEQPATTADAAKEPSADEKGGEPEAPQTTAESAPEPSETVKEGAEKKEDAAEPSS